MASAPVYALIAAAGIGKRVGAERPKQYLELAGKSVITRSTEVFLQLSAVRSIVVSVAAGDRFWSAEPIAQSPQVVSVVGGKDRAASVLAGLEYLLSVGSAESWVLVHDAARPLVRAQEVLKLINSVDREKVCGGLLAIPVTDTIKCSTSSPPVIKKTPDRAHLWQAQTPQLFRLVELHDALVRAQSAGESVTDEASALELLGHQPLLVPGRSDNIKITHASDLALAELLLQQQRST